jgi:PIN domain nuclease of toxin-antitoxin system
MLLDTHAFLWWLAGNLRLSETARRAIEDDADTIFVSAASAWEITTKHRIGKLAQAGAVALDVTATIAGQGFEELVITVDDAARAGQLPGLHRDPFDRMLIAQALARNLAIVSVDRMFDGYGVHRLW